jgi:hypothetical protein
MHIQFVNVLTSAYGTANAIALNCQKEGKFLKALFKLYGNFMSELEKCMHGRERGRRGK